jgi:hypothetical protein
MRTFSQGLAVMACLLFHGLLATAQDFPPPKSSISMGVNTPNLLVVHADTKIKSFKERKITGE